MISSAIPSKVDNFITSFGQFTQEMYGLPPQVVTKTAATAMAFFLLTIEMHIAAPICAGIAFSASVITVISYKLCRDKDKSVTSWFSLNFNNVELWKKRACFFAGFQLYMIALEHLLGVTFSLQMPIYSVIAYGCIWAPFVEEVIFRGFFQEQIQNSLDLLDRKIVHIKEATKKEVALIGQAILFGFGHINYFLFQQIFLASFGYFLGRQKNENKGSLIPCMGSHALLNIIGIGDLMLSNNVG